MFESMEQRWLTAKTPSALLDLMKFKRRERTTRMLLVGYLAEVEHHFTERSRMDYRLLQDWSEELIVGESAFREPRTYSIGGYTSPQGLVHEALREALSFAARSDQDSDLDHHEVSYLKGNFAGQALVLASVGNSPKVIGPDHPWHQTWRRKWSIVRNQQADLVRCVHGNPFRPIVLDRHWLTSSVLDLATSIYDERAFDRMPILGDALMDAGCAEEQVIQHCARKGPHVRGCWVVDLLLAES